MFKIKANVKEKIRNQTKTVEMICSGLRLNQPLFSLSHRWKGRQAAILIVGRVRIVIASNHPQTYARYRFISFIDNIHRQIHIQRSMLDSPYINLNAKKL